MTDLEAFRRTHYNATVVGLRRVHEDLLIVRVLPDGGPVPFTPGQYTTLGLGEWEPCVDGALHVGDSAHAAPALIRRAYSFGAAMVDAAGALLPPQADTANEFYVTLVHPETHDRPLLTPRLFDLAEGSRLYVGPKAKGQYTTAGVAPDDTLIFVATGTGEAPHNAMIADRLAAGHRGPIAAVTCVRRRRDLAYLAAHRTLAAAFPNYRYLWLTTREPENIDPTASGFVGKRYLQQFFAEGCFERQSGIALHPDNTHVYLCGNPQMIGDPRRHRPAGDTVSSTASGMIQVLERRGFTLDRPGVRGSIHVESYW